MDKAYTHSSQQHNLLAPTEIVPVLISMVKPASVLDVGCGTGTWLKVFALHGIKDLTGVDGPYVDRSSLQIDSDRFIAADLRNPLSLGRKFDLVVSLEVAEHLPESSADAFIQSLVAHGDVILFSAAVPGQGGQNHVNEQWPQYWAEKFKTHGFYFHDVIRPLFWNNPKVDWWYKQNTFLVTRERSDSPVVTYVHPEGHVEHIGILSEINRRTRMGGLGMRESFRIFVRSIVRALSGKSPDGK